jgi:hypothetical protein
MLEIRNLPVVCCVLAPASDYDLLIIISLAITG